MSARKVARNKESMPRNYPGYRQESVHYTIQVRKYAKSKQESSKELRKKVSIKKAKTRQQCTKRGFVKNQANGEQQTRKKIIQTESRKRRKYPSKKVCKRSSIKLRKHKRKELLK